MSRFLGSASPFSSSAISSRIAFVPFSDGSLTVAVLRLKSVTKVQIKCVIIYQKEVAPLEIKVLHSSGLLARALHIKYVSQRFTIALVKMELSGLNLRPQTSTFIIIVTTIKVLFLPQERIVVISCPFASSSVGGPWNQLKLPIKRNHEPAVRINV